MSVAHPELNSPIDDKWILFNLIGFIINCFQNEKNIGLNVKFIAWYLLSSSFIISIFPAVKYGSVYKNKIQK